METPDGKKVKLDEVKEEKVPIEIKWQEPTKAHGMRWQGFLMSDVRGDSSNRRSAKCKYCDEEFSNGKPSVLYKHIKTICPSVPDSNKVEYLKITTEEMKTVQEQTQQTIKTSTSTSTSTSNRKRKNPSKSEHDHHPYHHHHQEDTKADERSHECLLRSIIKSNSSFSILDEPNFQSYQIGLSPKGYLIPNSNHFIKVTIPLIYAKHQIESLNKLQSTQHLTLSIDHFNFNHHQFNYALIIHANQSQLHQLIDILEFSFVSNSSQNLFTSIKQTLDSKSLSLDQFDGLVSDHSNPIIQELINLFKFDYSHILHLNSSLHLITSISKLILSHPYIQPIINSNQILYDFFTTSTHWHQFLINFNQSNLNLQPSHQAHLQSTSNSGWSSIIKLSSWVHTYQLALRHATTLSALDPINPLLQTHPHHQLPDHIQSLIQDSPHLILNETLLDFVLPLFESFNRIKSTTFQISNLWSELISLSNQFSNQSLINLTHHQLSNEGFLEFKLNSIQILEEFSLNVLKEDEIYLIGLFLSPQFKHFTVSKKFTFDDLLRSSLKIVKLWKFNKLEAIQIKELLHDYYHSDSNWNPGESCYSYWSKQEPNLLKTFALRLLNLIPNTYPIEESFEWMNPTYLDLNLIKMIQTLKFELDYSNVNWKFDLNRLNSLNSKMIFENLKVIDRSLTEVDHSFQTWFSFDLIKEIKFESIDGFQNDILVSQDPLLKLEEEVWDIDDLI